MKTYELVDRIIGNFGFSPTPDQHHALDVFSRFLADRRREAVMILRGSAGTGKTSSPPPSSTPSTPSASTSCSWRQQAVPPRSSR